MKLTDHLPAADTPDPDALLDAFVTWTTDQGIELYPAQEEALMEVVTGSNVILSTPTGSGKSLVATGAHFTALAEGKRSFYTAPIKALVSEKFFSLVDVFGAENVGMMTGDSSVSADAPIICCTAEILANIALRDGDRADVDQVVMDEFHFYSEPDRGWAWQVPLLELPRTQFVLMSATLGDVTFFQEDLTRRTGRETAVVTSAERPIPLTFRYAKTPLHETIEELLAGQQAPIYVVYFNQASALEQAQALMSVKVASREQRDQIAEAIGDFRFTAGFGKTLSRLVRHGIGVHHAGCCRSTAAGRAAGAGRAAQGDLRDRHARRGHQRAHPHRAAHRPDQVRRGAHPAPQGARVPPDRRSCGARGLRHRRLRGGAGPGARDRERAGAGQGR